MRTTTTPDRALKKLRLLEEKKAKSIAQSDKTTVALFAMRQSLEDAAIAEIGSANIARLRQAEGEARAPLIAVLLPGISAGTMKTLVAMHCITEAERASLDQHELPAEPAESARASRKPVPSLETGSDA